MTLKVYDHGHYAGFKIYVNEEIVGWNIDQAENTLYFGLSRKIAVTIAKRLKIGKVI